MSLMCTLSSLLVIFGYFIELGAMQPLPIVEPGDTVTLSLNQMSNATFYCTCDECIIAPHWSLQSIDENNRLYSTDNPMDRMILAQRDVTYNNIGSTMAMISIPDRVENNNTLVRCVGVFSGSTEFSESVQLFIIGPPLPPDPIVEINNLHQLNIQWEVPYSHVNYPVVGYYIKIVNMSSEDVLNSTELHSANETSYVYMFENDVQYCQILTVNVTAVNTLGSSMPGEISTGFPIAPHPFELDMDNVDVIFLRNGTPMASISFEPPLICDYQTANYTFTIEDITDPSVQLAPIESTYNGGDRRVTEVVTLMIDRNYTLFISVIENHFKIEVSQSINFTTKFHHEDGKDILPHNLGIYIGVPIAVLLFFLLVAIIIVVILVLSIIRKKKEWRIARGGGDVRASSPPSVYETINDYQTHPEVKPHIHLSPQQQEFLWKVQHRQHGEASRRPRDDGSSYQEMMSSRATTEDIRVTPGGFIYPPFANSANQQNSMSTSGNPYTQQPCPAAAGSSASPVFSHTVTVTGQLSPRMVVLQDGVGGVFVEDDDQDYTVMSQAGTLTSQQNSRTDAVAQQQGQIASSADGNAALPTYSVVNKAEQSKSKKTMIAEC